jgi:hypothetical protein
MPNKNQKYKIKIAGLLLVMALFFFSSCSTSHKTRKHKGCDCPTWSMNTTNNRGIADG